MTINKKNIIFLDTNILSDIGRFDDDKIRKIVVEIATEMKLLIAVTTFNILEIEKISETCVKRNINYFLNLSNVVFLKEMNKIFSDEVLLYRTGAPIDPIQFITTLISKTQDGKPANYMAVLGNLLGDKDYKEALEEHYAILDKQQQHFQQKLRQTEDEFVEILFKEHLTKLYPEEERDDWKEIANCCPSYMAYAYSLYDKIGSKGLKKKAGEMNDTAMSYIFPYVGIVVTEKRQASVFNRIKDTAKIPALNDTIILKYSDVFKDGDFKLQEALRIEVQ
jgi:hypothetical protein